VVLRGDDVLGYPGNGDIDYSTYSDSNRDGHGTAVAVTIAGQGYGTGTVGIAPLAKILPVHVIYPANLNTVEHIATGIDYAVKHGAQVINISLGGAAPSALSCDPVLQDAVAYAVAHNVVVVASAGDTNLDGTGPQEPASCAGVLAVGAVSQNASLWPDSTRAPYVSVVAPGDHMVYVGSDGRYDTVGDGTSFSAPLVAGAAALIRSRYPSMPWNQVVQRLIDTAIHINSPVPSDAFGYGVIDLAKAVNATKFPVSASGPNPVYTRYLSWLRSSAGRSWAKANGVTVTSAGPSPTAAKSSPTAKAAAPATGSGGLSTLLIVIIVVVVLIVAAVIALILRSRNRSRRGPRDPGGPGGHGPPAYSPPGDPYQYPRQ
jgi:membrane-anchored mycosin MYCP